MRDFNKAKILAFLAPGDMLPEELLKRENVAIAYPYGKSTSFLAKLLRRLMLASGLGKVLLFVNLQKINIDFFDVVLVTENYYPFKLLQYVRHHNRQAKIYYWLWNTLFSRGRRFYNAHKQWDIVMREKESVNYQIVSFDQNDCDKYHLIYNGQVVPRFEMAQSQEEVKTSVFFGGIDKGRMGFLRKLADVFKKHGISYKYWILPDRGKKYSESDWQNFLHKKPLSYVNFLNLELKNSCILDIVQKGQHGITWRPIESLYYKKKLITNFKEITNYKFYSAKNIFVLGIDNPERLREFLHSPYEKVDPNIVNSYTFKMWLERLLDLEEEKI
jgi:hypothetical protein